MAEISIIMPVYNAEATLCRMIDSIVAQSFADWELIAVDDGSVDGSARMLDAYAESDSRIKVIHKPNGGVASARQTGLENACGAFIIHADSDDWVEPDMLRDMHDVAVAEGADIVVADFFTDNGSQAAVSVQNPDSTCADDMLRGLYTGRLFGGLWHKLIRRSVYDKGKVRFITGINYCEDLLVLTVMLLRANPKIAYLPKAYYHYMANDASLRRRVSPAGLESMTRFHAEAASLLAGVKGFEDVTNRFRVNEFIVLFTNRLYASPSHLRAELNQVRHIMGSSYGLRWKAGMWCIGRGLTGLAHHLIKF